MDNIKISICMPTRNRAGFIGTALESVISQADDSVEIVIVDGASTDNTPDVVQKYQQRFKNLVYCRQEINGGVDRDMAKAITLSRGEYCWLLSDDDMLKPGALKRILEEIKSKYEIYLCNITACNLFMKPYKELSWLSRDIQDRVFNLHHKSELIEYCNRANSIGAFFSFWSSIILRREVWIKSGYDYDFDKSAYALAATLFSSISKRCRLKYIKVSLVLWRNDNESFQNEGGLVKRFLLDFDGYLHLADKYLSFDPDVRGAFLGVMRREHPWYTIIHVASHIDNEDLWTRFKDKLFKFGYGQIMVKISCLLGKCKPIVFFGVKLKRKIVKSHRLHKIANCLRAAVKYIRQQNIAMFNYLLILNIFIGASRKVIFRFEFYLGYVFIIWFLIMYVLRYRSVRINSNFLVILIILTISSLVNVCFENDSVFFIAKQVVGILLTGSAYYLLIKVNDYSIEKLFKIYLRIALVVAAIGIFQEFSYLVKFKIGYDYDWMPLIRKWECETTTRIGLLRVNSIFTEPGHFAVSMAPAFFVSFLDIFKRNSLSLRSKWGSMIIIVSYILTFSLLAYITILISVLMVARFKRFRHLMSAMIIALILVFSAYGFVPDIRMRIDGIVEFFKHPSVTPDTHMSVYAVISNAFIAFNSFINNFLFGSGLGSHPVSYDKFSSLGIAKGFMWPIAPPCNVEVCKGDSGSLFLRLFSETGLFGVMAVFYFIFRFRLKLATDNSTTIVSSAIFILFVLQLLRMGHYFYNGLFFFVWVYYFAYKISNSKISELRDH